MKRCILGLSSLFMIAILSCSSTSSTCSEGEEMFVAVKNTDSCSHLVYFSGIKIGKVPANSTTEFQKTVTKGKASSEDNGCRSSVRECTGGDSIGTSISTTDCCTGGRFILKVSGGTKRELIKID